MFSLFGKSWKMGNTEPIFPRGRSQPEMSSSHPLPQGQGFLILFGPSPVSRFLALPGLPPQLPDPLVSHINFNFENIFIQK